MLDEYDYFAIAYLGMAFDEMITTIRADLISLGVSESASVLLDLLSLIHH